MMYIDKINTPDDLKKLSIHELNCYAEEVREYIIKVVNKNGGHLASNLGAVDFTIALHYVFDCPHDKIIFDVGHQSYAHKIITGRAKDFINLRKTGGLTGFQNMHESPCDAFSTGHSSTSLSVGLGLAKARDLLKDNYNVISVIGDGALTGGMAYEALNDIGASKTRMIIILNDNKMSISKNVGAMSTYLGKLRLNKRYRQLKQTVKRGIRGIPLVGNGLMRVAERIKSTFKKQLLTNKIFEQLGIRYFGAFDGHNIADLITILKRVKHSDGPALIHLVTNKGNGLYEAERNPEKYHGVDGTIDCRKKYSAVVAEVLSDLMRNNKEVVAVTAAMLSGTGLTEVRNQFPDRCFDVGIAEGHAVTMCAGMASMGLKPYFAVYSSFLQRGYDQIIHDVCINKMPVTFLIDRAGAVGADGVTHQGLYDLSYLGMVPNMTVAAPISGSELKEFIKWSLDFNSPLAIRYPKSYLIDTKVEPITLGKWQVMRDIGSKVTLLVVGNRMYELALELDCNIINARFIKPLDEEMLNKIAESSSLVITLEDNILRGGFGESVRTYYAKKGINCDLLCMGFTDDMRDELTVKESFEAVGLTVENLRKIISQHIQKK